MVSRTARKGGPFIALFFRIRYNGGDKEETNMAECISRGPALLTASDFPDPSVIRGGDTWYMASTTMHFFRDAMDADESGFLTRMI